MLILAVISIFHILFFFDLKLFLKEIDEKWRTKLFHLLVGTPIIG
jgi:hypothetical protein